MQRTPAGATVRPLDDFEAVAVSAFACRRQHRRRHTLCKRSGRTVTGKRCSYGGIGYARARCTGSRSQWCLCALWNRRGIRSFSPREIKSTNERGDCRSNCEKVFTAHSGCISKDCLVPSKAALKAPPKTRQSTEYSTIPQTAPRTARSTQTRPLFPASNALRPAATFEARLIAQFVRHHERERPRTFEMNTCLRCARERDENAQSASRAALFRRFLLVGIKNG